VLPWVKVSRVSRMTKVQTLEEIRSLVGPICQEYDVVTELYVYGPFAQGTQREESQVNLLVDGPITDVETITEMDERFTTAFGREVTLSRMKALALSPSKLRIQQEKKLVYEKKT
jgi:predicted nucleotidyltransferase